MELVTAIAANIVLGLVLAALLARVAKNHTSRLQAPEEALRIYTAQFPQASGPVTLSADGQTALIALQRTPAIGLVSRHGRRWNAKELSPSDLISAVLVAEDTIKLSLADFGWPRAYVRIPDHETRTDWLTRLARLRSTHA